MMRVDDGSTVEPVDARDPAMRELAPGVLAGHKFGAILAITIKTSEEKVAEKEGAWKTSEGK